ncbi:MAG: prolipoprotein diacylglyceryl transferase [Bacteroidetes bacterium]|nr:prolipoprotein diacylglyceryl transferase [Bacteroidota bacterium]|tara:strand:+ start:242 stop:565 length:324 start_codon:yes stop_codon:yes gene_type:complete
MSNKYAWIERLKNRWGIYSTFQVIIILIVFSLTGFSTLYIEKKVIDLLNIDTSGQWWVAVLIFIFITLPIYNVVLLVYGAIFGQFKFFWNFEKRFFGRIIKPFKRRS